MVLWKRFFLTLLIYVTFVRPLPAFHSLPLILLRKKRYHNSQAVVISALQVAKHPFITPGPGTVYTPPPTRHSTLPGAAAAGGAATSAAVASSVATGSLPHYYGGAAGTPTAMRRQDSSGIGGVGLNSVSSSGYPTPRPGSAASGFDNSFSMGSPLIGHHAGVGGGSSAHAQSAANLFRSFPRPHSSPKMKLRSIIVVVIS